MNKVESYLELVDHVQNGTKVKLEPQAYSVPSQRTRLCTLDDGKITSIVLSQSFLKSTWWTGPPTEWIGSWDFRPDACAYRTYMTDVTHAYKFPMSIPMLQGMFFETLALGSGGYGRTTGLPRNTRTGKPLANEDRIREAVQLFKRVAEQTGIIVDKSNTQVEKLIPVIDSDWSDIKVSVKVIADILSHFRYETINEELCVLDLKLTSDINSDFFRSKEPYKSFCWGLPDRMSVLQGTLYSEVFGFPFINLVFDFKANGAGWKPVPVKSIISHPMDSEAKLRHAEMGQGIKKAVNTLIEWNDNEWPRNPGSHCAKCIVESCEAKKIINHV